MITRHIFQIGLSVTAALSLCACAQQNPPAPSSSPTSSLPPSPPASSFPQSGTEAETPVTAGTVSKEVAEAFQALRNYSFNAKDDFQRWADVELQKRQPEIDALERKVADLRAVASEKMNSQVTPEVRAQFEQSQKNLADAQLKLDDAKNKLAEAKRRMDEMRDTTQQTWAESKHNFARTFEALKATLEQASGRARTAGQKPVPEGTPM